MHVIDYSWFRPSTDQLKAAGVTTVCRYLGYPDLGAGKVISKDEYDHLRAAGIGVILNWETTGKSWRGGYKAGAVEGVKARAEADKLGYTLPIIQSMDQAVQPYEINTAFAYQRGFNDGVDRGPQGAYGTQFILDHLFDLGLISVGWQTNARAWYGNRDDCARALLFQRTTYPLALPAGQYDFNDVNVAALRTSPYPFLSVKPAAKVTPMFVKPVDVVGGIAAMRGFPDSDAAIVVGRYGHVYITPGAPNYGGPQGPAGPAGYWGNREVADVITDPAKMTDAQRAVRTRYVIVPTSGEPGYAYGPEAA